MPLRKENALNAFLLMFWPCKANVSRVIRTVWSTRLGSARTAGSSFSFLRVSANLRLRSRSIPTVRLWTHLTIVLTVKRATSCQKEDASWLISYVEHLTPQTGIVCRVIRGIGWAGSGATWIILSSIVSVFWAAYVSNAKLVMKWLKMDPAAYNEIT